jgi:hypothetical protein
VSADTRHKATVRAFLRLHAKVCGCPFELRQERGALVCARCDAPLPAKPETPSQRDDAGTRSPKRTEIVEIVWAPRCPACRGATLRCLRCRQLYALRGRAK